MPKETCCQLLWMAGPYAIFLSIYGEVKVSTRQARTYGLTHRLQSPRSPTSQPVWPSVTSYSWAAQLDKNYYTSSSCVKRPHQWVRQETTLFHGFLWTMCGLLGGTIGFLFLNCTNCYGSKNSHQNTLRVDSKTQMACLASAATVVFIIPCFPSQY